MSEREKYPEMIVRFNAGEMDGEELRQFLELLRKNPGLQKEVELDKEINEHLNEETILDLRRKMLLIQKKKPDDRNRNLLFLLAASLLLLLSIGIFLLTKIPKIKTPSIAVTKEIVKDSLASQEMVAGTKDSISTLVTGEKQVILTASYQPDPAYETLVGTIMRSANFELLQPGEDQVFRKNGNILFRWEIPDAKKLTIRIVNNRGKQILEYKKINLQQLEVPVKLMPAGLFYYKILEDDEILFVGK
ncbi:MAG TPA: hypothetical protein VLR52_01395, partial [Bacteroidales bacterium]|nr:hypothetical protein [Bacteroidales bacterium]